MNTIPIYFELFGGLYIRRDGGEKIEFPPHQTGLLLGCFALSLPRKLTREEVICLFWPNEDIDQARQRLRQCLYKLRRQLEAPPLNADGVLIATHTHISLDVAQVQTDVAAFEMALKEAAQATETVERIACLTRAVEAYRGELLPGFYLDTITHERERLAEACGDALRALAHLHESRGDTDSAIVWAKRLIALDPLREDAHADLIRLYLAAGQPAAARRQYNELERVLREELDIAPSESSRCLLADLPPMRPASNVSVSSPPSHIPAANMPSVAGNGVHHVETALPVQNRTRRSPQRNVRTRALQLTLVLLLCLLLWAGWRTATRDVTLHHVWSRAYSASLEEGEKENSEGNLVVADTSGIYVAGMVETKEDDVDILVLRYNPNGKELWRDRYSSPERDCDRPCAMLMDRGGVFIAGETYVPEDKEKDIQGGWRLVLLRYEVNGKRSWVSRYPQPTDNGGEHNIRLARDGTGGVYLAGTQVENGTKSILVLRYDKKGELLWDTVCHPKGALETRLSDMVSPENAQDNNLYLCGAVRLAPTPQGGEEDGLVAQITPEGTIGWTLRLPGPAKGVDEAHRITMNMKQTRLILGMNYYTGDPAADGNGSVMGLALVSLTGRLEMSNPYLPSGPFSYITAVHPNVMTGIVQGPGGKMDILSLDFAENGAFYHAERYRSLDDRNAGSAAVTWLQGHYIVGGTVGYALDTNDMHSDVLLLDYGGDVKLRRQHLYDEPPGAFHNFRTFCTDAEVDAKRLYVVGQYGPHHDEAHLFLACYEMKP